MISLKQFHVFFIVVSILTCWGFGAWGIVDYRTTGRAVHLALSLTSCLGGVVLSIYLARILSKFKHLKVGA